LLPLTEVDALKWADPATWKAWDQNRTGREVPDVVYYEYSRKQDPITLREEYLDGLVLVGILGNGRVLALNPSEISIDGEWEAWYLSTRLPGALRFRSFAELMQVMYFADISPDSYLWTFSEKDLSSSCASRLRLNPQLL
jgi:hypothetical protein